MHTWLATTVTVEPLLGPKMIEAPGECRSNHDVICALAKRLGASHRGFDMTPREIIDWTLQKSGWGTIENLEPEDVGVERHGLVEVTHVDRHMVNAT